MFRHSIAPGDSYRSAIDEIQHSVGKRLFQELSAFEQFHYEKLTALEKSLMEDGKFIDYEGKEFPLPPIFEVKAAVEPGKKSLMTIIAQAIPRVSEKCPMNGSMSASQKVAMRSRMPMVTAGM